MIRQEAPEDFLRDLDNFNASRGGPTRVAPAWNPQLARWQIFAIPVYDSPHPLARNQFTKKLMKRLPDDSGREGVLIFTWCARDAAGRDVGFEPLDTRIFQLLDWADTFKDKQHFEKAIQEPELQREIAQKRRFRAVAGGVAEYWRNFQKLTLSMNPATRTGAGWRDAQGLR
jgi:hypothetical protein